MEMKAIRKLPILTSCGPCRGLEVDSTIGLSGPPQLYWVCAWKNRKTIPNTEPRTPKGHPPPEPPEWCPLGD